MIFNYFICFFNIYISYFIIILYYIIYKIQYQQLLNLYLLCFRYINLLNFIIYSICVFTSILYQIYIYLIQYFFYLIFVIIIYFIFFINQLQVLLNFIMKLLIILHNISAESNILILNQSKELCNNDNINNMKKKYFTYKNRNLIKYLFSYYVFYYFYGLLANEFEYKAISNLFRKVYQNNKKQLAIFKTTIFYYLKSFYFIIKENSFIEQLKKIKNSLKKKNRFKIKMFIKYSYYQTKRNLITLFLSTFKKIKNSYINLINYFNNQIGYLLLNPTLFLLLKKKWNSRIYKFYLIVKYIKSILAYIINKKKW